MAEPLRVLIVEDSEDDFALLMRELKRGGYNPTSQRVDTPEAMAAALDAGKWDVVLSDFNMPRFNGIAALRLLREKGLDLPFIIVSGKIGEDIAVEAMRASAQDYVMKDKLNRLVPAVKRELLEAVERRERKKAESQVQQLNRVLLAVRNVEELIVRERDSRRLLMEACDILVRTRGYRMAWIGLVEDGDKRLVPAAQAGEGADYLDSVIVTWDNDPPGQGLPGLGSPGKALRTRQPAVCQDIANDPDYQPTRDAALAHGYLSSASVPLLFGDRLLGALTVYSDRAHAFDDDEVKLLNELAGDLGFALQSIEDETRRARAEEALRHSEERFRSLAENATDIITVFDADRTITYQSPSVERILGFKPEEMIGKNTLAFIHPDDVETVKTKIWDKGARDQVFTDQVLIRMRHKDGSWRVIESLGTNLLDNPAVRGIVVNCRDVTDRVRTQEELKESYARFRRILQESVEALAAAVEKRDVYTAGHQRHVAQLACAIAWEMRLSDEEVEGIRVAGVLHDIGKIHVPSELLSNPGKLSDAEMSIIRTHPLVGYDILKMVEFPWPVAQAILQHHERINGSGYPAGLKGDQIIREAKILAVADVVEAMVTHRPFRPAHGMDEALREISENSGVLYDPEASDICLKLISGGRFQFEK